MTSPLHARDQRVHLTLTTLEKAKLDALAEHRGQSVNECLLQLVLDAFAKAKLDAREAGQSHPGHRTGRSPGADEQRQQLEENLKGWRMLNAQPAKER